jgi:low affinity Fe/Cu permease
VFERLACAISHWAGRPLAAIAAFLVIIACLVVWAATGYSEAFLDAFNLSISIVTALMLFVLQSSSNRDGAAIQVKLDELIRASEARNDFIGLDQRSQTEIESVRKEEQR